MEPRAAAAPAEHHRRAGAAAGQQGRWQTGADGAAATEWAGVESDRLGRNPRWDVAGKGR